MARRSSLKLAAIAAVCAAGLGLSACTSASPILTTKSYAASDGVRAQLSEHVRAENLMILTEGPGSEAALYGALVNNSEEPVTFTITVGDLPEQTVEVAPGAVVSLPQDGEESASGDYQPGATVEGSVATSQTGSHSVQVPILDGTIPPYDEYLVGDK